MHPDSFLLLLKIMSKTIDDVVQEARDTVSKMYDNKDRKDVRNTVQLIIKDMRWLGVNGTTFQDYNIDQLSRIAWNLAVYRASLEAYKNATHRNVSEYKQRIVVRKSVLREMLKNERTSQKKKFVGDDLKAEIDKQLVRLELELGLHEAEQERVNSTWYAIPTIIDTIDSRIKVLMSDISTSSHQKNASFAVDIDTL